MSIIKNLFSKKLTVGELYPLEDKFLKTPHSPKIITFWSSKGGTGKTSVAMNTCAYLSSVGKRKVLLIDIDEFGDTGFSSGLDSRYDGKPIFPEDLISNLNNINSFEEFSTFLVKEETSGFYMLMSPKSFDDLLKPSLEDYQKIVLAAAKYFNVIAFDCGDKLYDDYTKFALTNCNVLIAIADQGKPTLQNLSDVLVEFANPASGIGKNKIIMVVNKYREKVGMPLEEISHWFSKVVFSILPINALDKEFVANLNKGKIFIFQTSSKEIKKQYKDLSNLILSKFY